MANENPNQNRTATNAASTTPQRIPDVTTLPINQLSTQELLALTAPRRTLEAVYGGTDIGGVGPQGIREPISFDINPPLELPTITNPFLLQQQNKNQERNQTEKQDLSFPITIPDPATKKLPEQVNLVLKEQQAEVTALDQKDRDIFERDVNGTSIGPLQTFASEITAGFQRPSRFRVRFPKSPNSLSIAPENLVLATARTLLREGLICSSVSTPARTFETTELGFFGYDETYPTGTEFTSITCTFMLPLFQASDVERNNIYQYFVAWQNSIQNVSQDGSRTFRFPNEYRLTDGFIVETFSNQISSDAQDPNNRSLGRRTTATRYYNAYPKTITPTELSWGATDEFLTLSVEFLYTHWADVTDDPNEPQYG